MVGNHDGPTKTLWFDTTAGAGDLAEDGYVYVIAPFDGRVSAACLISSEDTTGTDVDSRTYQVINRGSDGTGTAVAARLQAVAGVDLHQAVVADFTVSDTVEDTYVNEGDVIEDRSVPVGDNGARGASHRTSVTFSRSYH